MDNYNEINKRIGQNLACYRKAAGYTQAELAEIINYSDKSVSKWEQGNGLPDVMVLMQLAKLYKVTLDELVGEDAAEKVKERTQRQKSYHVFIMLLSSGIIWLIATCVFVSMQMWNPNGGWWVVFVYAVATNAVLLIVYASVWRYRWLSFAAISLLIWTVLASVYLSIYVWSADNYSPWLLFLLGVPVQVLEIWWVFFRSFVTKDKRKKTKDTIDESVCAENASENEK